MPPIAATISSALVTGGGTSTFRIASCSFGVEQALGDGDGEVVLELQIVEADLVGDHRQQREDVEAELMAGVGGADARPRVAVEPESAARSSSSAASSSGHVRAGRDALAELRVEAERRVEQIAVVVPDAVGGGRASACRG